MDTYCINVCTCEYGYIRTFPVAGVCCGVVFFVVVLLFVCLFVFVLLFFNSVLLNTGAHVQ